MEASMPKNNVTDLITDQEIAFARLILSGTMTDRQAAEAVGLDPNSSAYTKSKSRVRAYMLEHRGAVEQQFVEQDTQELRRFNVSRDQVLTRLWDIANMDPERTRNSMSAQVKAISMIVAIEGLIPDRISARHSDRSAVSVQKQPAPPPVHPPFYVSEWARNQQHGESVDPQPAQAQQEGTSPEPQSAPARADGPPPGSSPTPDPTPNLSESSFFGGALNPFQETSSVPRVPMADYFAPDTRVPFSIPKNPFARRRL
jgi:hypothetical protein